MNIRTLLKNGREFWGNQKLTSGQIIICLGKVFSDLCFLASNMPKDKSVNVDYEIKKELGNIIFSTIFRCDDLGYDPEECIDLAIESQKKFPK